MPEYLCISRQRFCINIHFRYEAPLCGVYGAWRVMTVIVCRCVGLGKLRHAFVFFAVYANSVCASGETSQPFVSVAYGCLGMIYMLFPVPDFTFLSD